MREEAVGVLCMRSIAAGLGIRVASKLVILPDAGGCPLVDAGVAVGAGDIAAFAGASTSARDVTIATGPTTLILMSLRIHLVDHRRCGPDAIELHGLGIDLAGPGDPDVVFGEQVIHGGDIAFDGGGLPLLFEILDILPGVFVGMVLSHSAAPRAEARRPGRAGSGSRAALNSRDS
jgi:hypothetical protein